MQTDPERLPLVLNIDPEPLLLESLARKTVLLGGRALGAASVLDALAVLQDRKPDLVTLEVGPCDAADQTVPVRMLLCRLPQTRVVVLSGHLDVPRAVACMQAGAVNVLRKSLDEERLEAEILGTIYPSTRSDAGASLPSDTIDEALAQLTRAQNAVLGGLRGGLTSERIARKLRCSARTVDRRVAEICTATHVKTRKQLVRLLRQRPPRRR